MFIYIFKLFLNRLPVKVQGTSRNLFSLHSSQLGKIHSVCCEVRSENTYITKEKLFLSVICFPLNTFYLEILKILQASQNVNFRRERFALQKRTISIVLSLECSSGFMLHRQLSIDIETRQVWYEKSIQFIFHC